MDGTIGPIVIEGHENVKAVQELQILHKFRMIARKKINFNAEPPKGWTIRAFNAKYETNLKTWEQVFSITDATIKDMRAELTAK